MKKDNVYMLFLILVMAVWGGSWTSGKLVTVSAAPALIVFLRFLFTTLCTIPFVFIFKTGIRVSLSVLAWLGLGGLLLFLYNMCFFSGLHNGLPGAGGVLVTTMNPILTYLLTVIIFRKKSRLIQIAGLLLGFAGGLVMLEIWKVSMSDLLQSGNLVFLLGSLLWAFITLISSHLQKQIHFIIYSFYVYAFSALFAFVFTLAGGDLFTAPNDSSFWLNIIYLSVIVTALATTYYFLCTSKLGSRRASSFIFAVPVSAVISSWIIIGEVPTLPTIIGGVLAAAAVFIININGEKQPSEKTEGKKEDN